MVGGWCAHFETVRSSSCLLVKLNKEPAEAVDGALVETETPFLRDRQSAAQAVLHQGSELSQKCLETDHSSPEILVCSGLHPEGSAGWAFPLARV